MIFHRVVFIDPGSTCGWAMAAGQEDNIIASVEKLRGPSYGQRVQHFWSILCKTADPAAGQAGSTKPLVALLFEESFQRSTNAAQVYGGWVALMTHFAERHKIPYCGISVNTIWAYVKKQGLGITDLHPERRSGGQKKYNPRPEWKLSAPPGSELSFNESDARWGLEYVLQAKDLLSELAGTYSGD